MCRLVARKIACALSKGQRSGRRVCNLTGIEHGVSQGGGSVSWSKEFGSSGQVAHRQAKERAGVNKSLACACEGGGLMERSAA